jgi:serine protease Do
MRSSLPPRLVRSGLLRLRLIRSLVLCLGLVACAPASNAQRGAVPAAGFADLVEQVMPAVVNIAAVRRLSPAELAEAVPPQLRNTPMERQWRERNRGQGQVGAGSGFVVDAAGFIVTNAHVVGGASAVRVTFANGESLPARIVGTDDATDIALLKVEATRRLPAVALGSGSRARVGDWILAVGNPYGLGGTVTAGILSARGRDIGAGPFDDFLQIDAPINPGNSGGPTFNMAGEVIGVNTAIVSPGGGGSVGIGFAVPAELVAPVVSELRANGRIARGWLGVTAEPLSAAVARQVGVNEGEGVRIAELDRNGPAFRGGVRVGDVIVAVNGEPVPSPRALARNVATQAPGSEARVTVLRQGRRQDIGVTLGTRPAQPQG